MNSQDPAIVSAIIGASALLVSAFIAGIFQLRKWREEKKKLNLEIKKLELELRGPVNNRSSMEELCEGMRIIARKLWQKDFRPDVLVSFNRSGTALAGMFAVNMRIDEILTVSRHRDQSNSQLAAAKRQYVVGELLNINAPRLLNRKILAVMMLMETGDTIEEGLRFLEREGITQNVEIAAMYITPGAKNRWPNVIFAYETNEPKGVLEKLPWVDTYDFV
jgi:hypoxanthine phosphoribosyltransferase